MHAVASRLLGCVLFAAVPDAEECDTHGVVSVTNSDDFPAEGFCKSGWK